MTLVTERAPTASVLASAEPNPRSGRAAGLLAALPALALAAGSVLIGDGPTAAEVVRAVLVVLWAAAGAALMTRRPQARLGRLVLVGALIGGAGTFCSALDAHRTPSGGAGFLVDLGVRLSAALLPAIAMHLLLAMPDGNLGTSGRRTGVTVMYGASALAGVALLADRDTLLAWPLALLWLVAFSAGLVGAHARYQQAGATDRRRMQWVGWALAVGAEAVLVVLALSALTGRPSDPGAWAIAVTGLVPVALIASTFGRAVARVDRLLTYTVSLAGLTALVVGVYAVVVLALARTPEGSERTLLLASMGAAALAALIWLPARRWLSDTVNRVVYGERVSPDEALRTWGSRLTRAIPMDELLLQLCESLRKTMGLVSAEVWTGSAGSYDWATGVPHRTPPTLAVGDKERPVVARAGVSGGRWLEIWLPELVAQHPSSACRVAPLAHQGELLGLIVCRRPDDGEAFTEEDDRVLAELARQVGLALHNMQLDSALQASLAELQTANDELRASRARIVAAGDAERRKLERNLHDGAQQHLVALAVKLRLAKDAVEDEPDAAMEMMDELRGDIQDAIQELRALAHGIFPPLLVSGGLAEALPAAGTRAALPTSVEVSTGNRYPSEVEAAVYFCCLEALQNAGKHAGDGASATVRVWEEAGQLRFEVRDNGAGFDAARPGASLGHGFVNMADRLGAIDGSVTIDSAPGQGTTISGRLPVPAP